VEFAGELRDLQNGAGKLFVAMVSLSLAKGGLTDALSRVFGYVQGLLHQSAALNLSPTALADVYNAFQSAPDQEKQLVTDFAWVQAALGGLEPVVQTTSDFASCAASLVSLDLTDLAHQEDLAAASQMAPIFNTPLSAGNPIFGESGGVAGQPYSQVQRIYTGQGGYGIGRISVMDTEPTGPHNKFDVWIQTDFSGGVQGDGTGVTEGSQGGPGSSPGGLTE
jgi:hypothetical protein